MWFDALGRRLPEPYLPGYDTLGTLRYLRTTPDIADHDHSWFILRAATRRRRDLCPDPGAGPANGQPLQQGCPGPGHPQRPPLPRRPAGPGRGPHKILDSAAGPLIAVKLHILTRKSLGGIQTDLHSRALGRDGHPIDGLYAAGEVAGFGGGGAHGYNALEGTFLGGCLFSGRTAGRDLTDRLRTPHARPPHRPGAG